LLLYIFIFSSNFRGLAGGAAAMVGGGAAAIAVGVAAPAVLGIGAALGIYHLVKENKK
jgi:hypothetical protein